VGYPIDKCRDIRVGTGVGNTPIQDQDCVDPVYYCRHGGASGGVDGGCASVTGGVILDDCHWPDTIRGQYVFGDNSTNSLWMLTPTVARDGITGGRIDFGTINATPVAFRIGNDGALYVAAHTGNRIVRISPKAPATCVTTTTTSTVTTSTLPGETTSTTTTVTTSTSTTSTTIAGPCGTLEGFALAGCQVAPLRADPLCGTDIVPPGIAKAVHTRAEAAASLLTKAEAAPTRRMKRLLGKTDRTLKGIVPRLARAGRRLQISSSCQTSLGAAVTSTRATVAALRAL
jgi:hypothetical protein